MKSILCSSNMFKVKKMLTFILIKIKCWNLIFCLMVHYFYCVIWLCSDFFQCFRFKRDLQRLQWGWVLLAEVGTFQWRICFWHLNLIISQSQASVNLDGQWCQTSITSEQSPAIIIVLGKSNTCYIFNWKCVWKNTWMNLWHVLITCTNTDNLNCECLFIVLLVPHLQWSQWSGTACAWKRQRPRQWARRQGQRQGQEQSSANPEHLGRRSGMPRNTFNCFL